MAEFHHVPDIAVVRAGLAVLHLLGDRTRDDVIQICQRYLPPDIDTAETRLLEIVGKAKWRAKDADKGNVLEEL